MGKPDLTTLRFDGLVAREWLATFGNGGFASSTLCGLNTRKYHGLLVAAMSPPVRRMVLLSRVEETIQTGGRAWDLSTNEYPGVIHPQGHSLLRAFSHEPFPRWAYQADGWTIEKELRPLQGENAVLLSYTLLGGTEPVEIELRPLFALRPIHELMFQWNGRLDSVRLSPTHHRLPATSRSPEVFFAHDGTFSAQPCWYLNTIYRREQERGYSGLEDLWMPGVIRCKLLPGQTAHFACSTEPIDLARVVAEAQRQSDAAVPALPTPADDPALAGLLRAAEQFVVQGKDRVPSVIGGYPWSPPVGRDAMICLPGLLLVPGRIADAQRLLHTFAGLLRDSLMPSEMAEDGSGYRYTAADTSLWFIHAVGEFLRYRGDEAFVAREMLPVIERIIDDVRHGASAVLSMDADGLVRTHTPGVPATWMDAKVGDWVITPRQGRPVSVNALWYNALGIAADLCRRFGQPEHADILRELAAKVKKAFNARFWNADAECCYDVVEDHGSDPSVRPNQVLAISLPYAVLDESRHAAVLQKVRGELLTPFGLRTLSPSDPSYQHVYSGPVVSRDRAHHQGSVFPWLLGPFVSAFLKVNGRGESRRAEAMGMLEGCLAFLDDTGMGRICELFDGDAPHRPGGSVASARSVAEILRCYAEDILNIASANPLPPRVDLFPLPQRDEVNNAG